jgi:hypothetical protein
MLLNAERPFVGALAVRIPGATLRHRNGLVPAVLLASPEHEGTDNWGSPGTCEIRSFPQRTPGRRYRDNNSETSVGMARARNTQTSKRLTEDHWPASSLLASYGRESLGA